MERQLQARGMGRAPAPGEAQLVVLNTCTVTAAADQDARAAIRRIHRENPGCEILVTGCYAQRAPEELAGLPGVKWVVGNSHKHRVAEIAVRDSAVGTGDAEQGAQEGRSDFVPLQRLRTNDQRQTGVFVSDIFAHTELLAAPVFDAANERTRPNLKVQDGCDNRCSFCVIPYVRGQSRSLPLEQVLREVDGLVAGGYREVVISGINLGRWGRDLASGAEAPYSGSSFGTTKVVPSRLVPSRSVPSGFESSRLVPSRFVPSDFASSPFTSSGSVASCGAGQRVGENRQERFEDLVHAILDHTSLEKLRISSVEPMDWSDELIRLVAESPRIAKHAHVPMQSGSDAVLRRMHRKYRPWHYREKIEKIRAAMPTAAIGADVMVGFPGETDSEFDETRRMVEELPFTYLHVFTYSARPGTPAADMRNQVPVRVARDRNRILRDLAAQKKLEFMRSFVGKTIEAITLNVFDGEHTEALTDNYLKLRLAGRHEANRWVTGTVDTMEDELLMGRLKPFQPSLAAR